MTRRPPISRHLRTEPPGRVRIVAGKWRGRFLPVADVPGLRPTPERVRETLFNWLAPTIEGARCLDLFAGTGVLGFESLSRGAAEVTMVETHPAAVAALYSAIADLGATSATLHPGDAHAYLRRAEVMPLNVVFLDPPFADSSLAPLFAELERRHWLAAGACLYLERDAAAPVPHLPPGWTVRREKKAGNVSYSLIDAPGTRSR